MSACKFVPHRSLAIALFALLVCSACPTVSRAQGGNCRFSNQNNQRSVGGVLVNGENVVDNVTLDDKAELIKIRREALEAIGGDARKPSKLRMISLRKLQNAIEAQQKNMQPLSDEMYYLAGLQRIEYVFAFPDQKDIVIAGPAEPWLINDEGNLVGKTSGRPVVRLEDLLIALRTVESAQREAISCSIDPTPEGMSRVQSFLKKQTSIGTNPQATIAEIERQLGPQTITVTGVPATSRFANVLVAADYKMKRLAMNFEQSPVKGMPSYLEMLKDATATSKNMTPRWWMAPRYEPLLKDAEGLSWKISGAGVKTIAEEDFFNADGKREKTVKASPLAQKWAQTMTDKYEELAGKDTIFGELRNCMDLAVVAALITKHHLLDKAGLDTHLLFDGKQLITEEFNAPKHVNSKASYLKKGKNWIISTSGGVQIQPMDIVANVKESAEVAETRGKLAMDKGNRWWWD